MAVGVVEGGAHLRCDLLGPLRREGALVLDDLLQGLALDELHDEEVRPAVGPPVVDGDDAGVVQAGRRLGLPAEALDEGTVPGELRMQDLESDRAAEQAVAGDEDLGHPTGGEGSRDLVAPAEEAAGLTQPLPPPCLRAGVGVGVGVSGHPAPSRAQSRLWPGLSTVGVGLG